LEEAAEPVSTANPAIGGQSPSFVALAPVLVGGGARDATRIAISSRVDWSRRGPRDVAPGASNPGTPIVGR
jgi:hypothetical protein